MATVTSVWSGTLFSTLYRSSILGIAGAAPVERLMRRLGFRIGVGRFVAGEHLDDALAALARLQDAGLGGILDLLGEFVDTRDGVDDMVNQILVTLDRLAETDLDRYMSVKPTQLGLGLGMDTALGNARAIAQRARVAGAHVCLDMENHPYTDQTLELFRQLQLGGFSNTSTVLQSYLHRTVDDLRQIAGAFPTAAVRLVKGAYREPASVAYQDKATVDSKFLELVDLALGAGMHTNIATHDERLIAASLDRIAALGIDSGRYEFQFLYGVKPRLQKRLRDEGHAVRIYVPYGHDWYGYFSRRLAERPANLGVVVRGLFG